MGKTIFSHELRLAMCANCGAPLEVAVDGGMTKCGYCHQVNRLDRRDESRDRTEAQQAQAQPLSESARMEMLRAQDNVPLVPPPDLARLLLAGAIPPAGVQPALAEWVATRNRVQHGAPFVEQERLFHLTLLLAPGLSDRHERALLENAVEILPDSRHRQVLRCRLAHKAVLAGDHDAARDWLEPCNPRPVDLRMDTAYRLASSYLATAQREWPKVLALLGHRPDDVPIADGHDTEAAVLRANAMEKSGNPQAAGDYLLIAMSRDLRNVAAIRNVVQANAQLGLCAGTHPLVHQQLWQRLDADMRPKKIVSIGCLGFILIFPAIGLLIISAAIIGLFGNNGAVIANAIVHPGIWLVFLPGLAFWAALSSRRTNSRLQKQSVLTFAHVMSCQSETVRGKNSTTILQRLLIEVELGPSRVPTTASVTQDELVPLGAYPCLVDPADLSNMVLKVKPMV
jgi:hypothetical protein